MSKRRRLNQQQLYRRAPAESSPAAPSSSDQSTGNPGFQNDKTQNVSDAFPTTTTASASRTEASVVASSTSATAPPRTSKAPTHSAVSASSSHPNVSSSSLADPTTTSALPTSSLATSADTGSEKGISGSAIGAIVAIVLIILCGLAAYFFVKRQQKRKGMANNRLTRFSMGPTYNATAGPGPEPMFGHNNNAPPTMAAPYPFNNSNYNNSMGLQQEKPPALAITTTANVLSTAVGPAPAITTAPMATPAVAAAAADAIFTPIAEAPPPSWLQQQPIGTYTVVAGYKPTLSDEIPLSPGDQVQVLVEYDDGWCMGTNLTAGQQKGVFPKHCITPPPVNQQHPQQQQQQQYPSSDMFPALNFMANTSAAQKRASSLVGSLPTSSLYH